MDPGPASPDASGRPGARSRGISFRSDRSGGSKSRSEPLVESPRERDRKSQLWTGQTKANPNAALAESQPGERSIQEASTLQNLRDMEHKDHTGQLIVDPDLSNPTRPRLERPLDTIRSFEKAIDSGYKRRSSYAKQDSAEQHDQNNQYASRRSSYFGGHDGPNNGNNQRTGGGYYGPPQQQRPDSAHMNGGGRQRFNNRMQSSGDPYGGQRPHPPQHGYTQSHDTGNTYNSDSTGPWANSTDPSSENSSIDRNLQNSNSNGYMPNKPQTPGSMEGGGGGGGYYGGPTGPIMEEQGYDYDGYGGPQQQQQYQNQQYQHHQQQYGGQQYGARPPPNGGPVRKPIPLGGMSAPPGGRLPSAARPEPEKKDKAQRKSWLKRTFSKG